jgi:hypothetical protein
MDVFRKLARAADEARRRIERGRRSRHGAALAGEPVGVVREEALPAAGHAIALLDRLDAVGDVEPQELAEIGADQVAPRLAAEHRRGRRLLPGARCQRFREGVEVGDGRGNERIRFIVAERHVPRQRAPIHFRHVGCHVGAGKGRRRVEAGRGGIEANEIEGVGRLRIIQFNLGVAVARDCFEAIVIAACENRHERREGIGIDLAGVVVGQRLGKARALVGVARFVAVRTMHRLRLVEIGLRRRLTHAECCRLAW